MADVHSAGDAGQGVSFRAAQRVWAHIGLNSFGGPAGQIAVMHRELVDERRWVSERRFLHALNYCMVLPGPEAQQLATYIGWLMHGVAGGVVAGALFILPGFAVMLLLAATYAVFGHVIWVSGLLLGVQAAVVATVAQAVLRIGRRSLRTTVLRGAAACSFIAIFFLDVPFPVIVVAAALFGAAVGRVRPRWMGGGSSTAVGDEQSAQALLADDERADGATTRTAMRAALAALVLWVVPVVGLVAVLGTDNVFAQESLLFSKAAVVTFGGAYAVLGYVAQQAVGHYAWISAAAMVTSLGLAETTPGPLILVVEFVGFLAAYNHPGSLSPVAAGALGAVVSVWVTFLPCFLFIFLGAPYVERLRNNRSLAHALSAIGAAVAGVVLNLAVWFALHTFFTTVSKTFLGPLHVYTVAWSSMRIPTALIAAVAMVFTFRTRLGTLRILALCAVAGGMLSVLGVR